MEVLIKISAMAIMGTIVMISLRRTLPEMSVTIGIALVCALCICASEVISKVVELIFQLAEWADISHELILPLIKTLGISIVAKIAADMCRENGIASAASIIELAGGAVAISFAIPLMIGLLEQIAS